MNAPPDDPRTKLRQTLYVVLIVVSAGAMLGRILAVDSVDLERLERNIVDRIPAELEEKRQRLQRQGARPERIEQELRRTEAELWNRRRLMRPFLSANDRSRWCAIRALVEPEMRVPGAPYSIDKVIQEPTWDTIDMVKHDGRLYSSKPPLFPTLAAIPYWLIHKATWATLGSHPYAVGRAMLVLVNVIPLVIGLLLVARLVERFGTTDWGRIFVMSAAAFGTFLTTFAVVLNNHLPAAVSAAEHGADLLLWFEPERVRPGTKLDGEHPEWLLRSEEYGPSGMLYLGNPECRQWLTDHVCKLIDGNGIKIYRQDHNFPPLDFWRENDGPEREGIHENLHVRYVNLHLTATTDEHPSINQPDERIGKPIITHPIRDGRPNDDQVQSLWDHRPQPLLSRDFRGVIESIAVPRGRFPSRQLLRNHTKDTH